jgi:hypothetical protein
MAADDDKRVRVTTPPALEEFPTLERDPASAPSAGEPAVQALNARYDLLGELGRGGMGVVWRARDRETDEIVALKVLKPEIAAQSEHVERFKAELRLARRITHKNVCRVYELLRFGDTAVIAMEYVEGDSLRTVLRRFGTAPFRRGLEWARQIAAALAEAHAQGIVHRDLKPENVIIDASGHARVLDFGIARSLDVHITQAGSLIGTPTYMSPEQAQGQSADARSDIYALGLLLYEMFTGRPAFHADTPVAVVRKHIEERPQPPRTVEPFIPAFVERVILRCLEKDPVKRYASMTDLLEDLEGRDAPETQALAGVPERLSQARRSDALLVLAGTAGLAAFLALAPRLQPESDLRLRATPSMLVEQARQELTRRGWTPTSRPAVTLQRSVDTYMFLAEKSGAAVARERLNRDFPPFFVRVVFQSDQRSATIQYELDGTLRAVQLPVVGWVPPGPGLSREPALAAAQAELRRLYGIAGDDLEMEYDGPLTPVEGRRGYRFQWVQRDPSGIARRYQVDVYDRVTSVQRLIALPEDYRSPRGRTFAQLLLFAWIGVPLTLFLARRVFNQVRLREVSTLAVVGFLWSIGIGLAAAAGSDNILTFFVSVPVLTLGVAAVLTVLSSTSEYLAQRRWPELTAGYTALIRWRPDSRALGLALVRGGASGLLLLGINAGLLWLGMRSGWSWPRIPQRGEAQMLSAILSLSIPADVLIQTLFGTLFLGFVLVMLRRWTAVTPVLVVVAGALYAVSTFAAPTTQWFELAQVFVLWASLAYIAARFDLLTLVVAVFTLDLWSRFFVLTQVLAPVGAGAVWVVFAGWAIVLAWAAFVGFRPLWQRLGGRLAGSFD